MLIFLRAGGLQKGSEKPKHAIRPGIFYSILTKGNKLWRSEEIKEREFWLYG